MRVNVIHPEEQSLGLIRSAIIENETIWRSPHVGNVNGSELSLMFGIGAMGGTMQIELVDTIRGDDNYSDPRSLITKELIVPLASRNYAKSRIVGACAIDPAKAQNIVQLELAPSLAQETMLKRLHIKSLQAVLPESIMVRPSSELYACIGQRAYELLIKESAVLLDKPVREVDAEGKFMAADLSGELSLYGMGENKNIGLLPSLEGMIAIEFINKALASEGSDGRIVHIAGPDMIRYTKEDAVMLPSIEVARRVLGGLGVCTNVEIDYVVPCMKQLINTPDFPQEIGDEVVSQYDILLQKTKEESM